MSNKTYVGIDFHKNFSELCFQGVGGEILERVRVKTEKLETILRNRETLEIGIEVSGGVFDIGLRLEKLGHIVRLINPSQFRAIGVTGKKNDRNDAEALATALRLGFIPEVYKKALYPRQIKSLLQSREVCITNRVSLTNHTRGILREYGMVMPAGRAEFWKHVRSRLEKLDCGVLQNILGKLVEEARKLEELEKETESALLSLVKDDERVTRLQTVPGVGFLSACIFAATIDDASRFSNCKKVGSYLGLTPKEKSSGDKKRFGRITKAGPELCRRYFIHGARTLLRHDANPKDKIRAWGKKVEERAGGNKAAVALAHKNARICFAILRDGTSFGITMPFKKIAA
jgi:transposase